MPHCDTPMCPRGPGRTATHSLVMESTPSLLLAIGCLHQGSHVHAHATVLYSRTARLACVHIRYKQLYLYVGTAVQVDRTAGTLQSHLLITIKLDIHYVVYCYSLQLQLSPDTPALGSGTRYPAGSQPHIGEIPTTPSMWSAGRAGEFFFSPPGEGGES